MGKKRNIISMRVIVEPRRLGDYGYASMSDSLVEPDHEKAIAMYRDRCNDIVSEIKRHVNETGNVYIDEEAEMVCEHCGAQWTEDTNIHNGGCCDVDCDVYEKHTETVDT